MNKMLLTSAISAAIFLTLPGCSSSGSDAVVDTVTISGTVLDTSDAALPGVTIEAVYNNPGDLLNPKVTSDASGKYSLAVLKSDGTSNAAYLHASKDGFATMNTAKDTATTNTTQDIGLPTTAEAQSLIDAAYPGTTPALSSKAWIAADVYDASGNDIPAVTITVNGATANAVYTDCDGSYNGSANTVDCSGFTGGRQAPAYVASFDANATVTVTDGTSTQTVVLRVGEIANLEFDQ